MAILTVTCTLPPGFNVTVPVATSTGFQENLKGLAEREHVLAFYRQVDKAGHRDLAAGHLQLDFAGNELCVM